MSDIEKSKKGKRGKTRVHVHFYENLNKPRASVRPATADALAEVERHDAMEDADVDKSTGGNPVVQRGGRSLTAARVSPSRVRGNASPGVDDHGSTVDPMNVPGPRELAFNHPNMRQSSTSFDEMITRLRTVVGDNHSHSRDINYTVGQAALRLFDSRGAAGFPYAGMNPVGHAPVRQDWHTAPINATGPNGGHSTANPTAPPRMSMKGSDRVEIMRQAMFPGSGGAR